MAQNSGTALFTDDFVNICTDTDMNVEEPVNFQESFTTSIRILENTVDIQARLKSLEHLAHECVPTINLRNIENKIMRYLMPASKKLLTDVFKEICLKLPAGESREKSVETFNVLQEYLRTCLGILTALNDILEYILQTKQINLCYIESVPLNIVQIIISIFQHCKESNKLYKDYFDNLKEILLVFTAAQDLHAKLLKLLEDHITINCLSEEEVSLLKNVLHTLAEVGEILVDMNVKALADNWKGYLTVTQKYADILMQNAFNISGPLNFFSKSISKNLDTVLKMSATDQKGPSPALKICNFFVRIALKLLDGFWPCLNIICESATNFLLSIYRFYPPFLKYKGHSEHAVVQIETLVRGCADPLLVKLLGEAEFYKVIASKMKANQMDFSTFLFLLTTVFQKLPVIIADEPQAVHLSQVPTAVAVFFGVITESYSELFWNVVIRSSSHEQHLFDENVANISQTVLSLDQKQFNQVELVLLRNIMQECIWNAIMATDIWCYVLKQKNTRLAYETLRIVVTKVEPLLLQNFTSRPETVFLGHFLHRLFVILPEDYRENFVDDYPPGLFLHIWKVLGFGSIPKSRFVFVESMLNTIVAKIERLNSGHCDVESFTFFCNSCDAMSSLLEKNEAGLKYWLSAIASLWHFKVDSTLQNSAYFKCFLRKLCKASGSFIVQFSNEQVLLILTKLNQLVEAGVDIKMQALEVLNCIRMDTLKQTPELRQIAAARSQIISLLCSDANPIVKQCAYRVYFISNKDCLDPYEYLILEKQRLLERRTNFKKPVDMDEYFSSQKNCKFKHTCPDLPIIGKEKVKSNPEEIGKVFERIRGDVELLHMLCGKENVLEEDITEVLAVLRRQIGYKT